MDGRRSVEAESGFGGPTGGFHIPNNTPPGLYFLCAKVDPDQDLSETTLSDNVVRSDNDRKFEVLTCD